MSLPTHWDSGTMSHLSEDTLAEPLKHSLEEHMHKSDSEATPKSSIGEYIHSKTFVHSPDRLDLTEISSLDLLRVTEASIPNRISVSSRQPGNEQAMSCNRGIAPDFAPSFQRSIACRLPPELLEAIFLIYAQDYRNSTHVPRWIAVSYICQYWCNVALGCAHLWAYLFFVSPEWIDEQLRRSNTAPLMVHIHLPLTLCDLSLIRSLEKVLENLNRIQDLGIGSPSHDMVDVINAKLNAAAPLLQSFYLSAMDCPSHFIIPKDTFLGAMSLQKVHLEICDVDWSSHLFNGLTELTLHSTLNRSRKNWDGVLLILRRSPHLHRLCLSEVLPLASISPPSENMANSISLP